MDTAVLGSSVTLLITIDLQAQGSEGNSQGLTWESPQDKA